MSTPDVVAMAKALREKLEPVNKIDPDGAFYKGVCNLLDECTDEAILYLSKQEIKFVSSLALNRVIRRKIA